MSNQSDQHRTQTSKSKILPGRYICGVGVDTPCGNVTVWTPPELPSQPSESEQGQAVEKEDLSSFTPSDQGGASEEKPCRESSPEPRPDLSDIPIERIAILVEKDVAEAVRTFLLQPEGEDDLPGSRKAAILIGAIGDEVAVRILQHLSDFEVENIIQALSKTEVFTSREKKAVFEEARQIVLYQTYRIAGGVVCVQKILERLRATSMYQNLSDWMSTESSIDFSFLKNIPSSQIITLAAQEHPQTIALILSQMEANQAAEVLSGLSSVLRADATFRLTRLDKVEPETLQDVKTSLSGIFERLLKNQVVEIDGPGALGTILRFTGHRTMRTVIGQLRAQGRDLGDAVANRVFTFEDIAMLTDREIQMIVRETDLEEIAVALIGASEEIKARVFCNVSRRMWETITYKMRDTGRISKIEAQGAQQHILQVVRQLEEAGQVRYVWGDEKDIFV